ncbi:MAG: type ISP restriction/modification enzyme, partial [Candidatus Micrarchaeaceae archaeon]
MTLKRKKALGVFYTPRPIVNYIVSAVEWALKDLGYKDGFLDRNVKVLEPAMGTGSFLWMILAKLAKKYHGNETETREFIENHIFKDFYGFEILIISYILAHIKLESFISDSKTFGYYKDFSGNNNLKLYLTNTLDDTIGDDEIKNIRTDKLITVIVGNPPYNRNSQNKTKFIDAGLKLNEAYGKGKGTADDYAKFIRFAEYKMEKVDKGVVGFITNNSFLDGITQTKMREHLYNSFNKIYIINLHGDYRRDKELKEKNDQNVFGIKQGIAIEIFIKDGSKKHNIYYKDLVGTKEYKFKTLEKMVYDSSNNKDINPFVGFEEIEINNKFEFIPRNFKLKETDIQLTEIFDKIFNGVTTLNDNYLVDFKKEELIERMKALLETNHQKNTFEYINQNHSYKIKSNNKINLKDLSAIKYDESLIIPYCYRIFDTRYLYYDNNLVYLGKLSLYKIISGNKDFLQICIPRKVKTVPFIFITNKLTDQWITVYPNINSFPLYSSPNPTDFNIKKPILDMLSSKFNKPISPEEVFYYVVAVLNSKQYQEEYKESLSQDFPYIPFDVSLEKFNKLAALGKEVALLEILESPNIEESSKIVYNEDVTPSYTITKEDYKTIYNEQKQELKLNNYISITNVPKEVFEFKIGDYPVIQRWIKYRVGYYDLPSEQITTLCKTINAIKEL